MPTVSSSTAPRVDDFGVAVDHSGEIGDYTVNFVSIRESHDLAGMLEHLPGGRCGCPHWGYVLKGRLTVRYADHEEEVNAGDAFYFPPGHVPAADAGTELVQFSPADELATTTAAIRDSMRPS